MSKMLTLDKVYRASQLLKGVARRTDMIESYGLTDDCQLRLKAENLQLTGSFKLRGAYFKIASLPQDDREIVACSAGNHSQGVSLAAGKLHRKAVIFMPSIAPISKVEATKKLGAEVHLVDGVYDDAYLAANAYCKEHNSIFVHPFDDEDVIAGQGSVALEILEQFPQVDTVIRFEAVPDGGGLLPDLKDTHPSFMGMATYRTTIILPDRQARRLHLGKVCDIAEVWINGSYAGLRWWGDPVFDLDGLLKPGENEIEIRVTTQMCNYMRTLTDNSAARRFTLRRNHEPVSAGLLGPVTLY